MRLALFVGSIIVSAALFCYSILAGIGTAVSYKFEVDDPTVEMGIHQLPYSEQARAWKALELRKTELEWQSVLFTVLAITSVLIILLLIVYRKKLLGKQLKY
ncbi:MAG: hypothetical protein V4604_15200 [Bacteroidota bacterium]